MPNVKGNGGRGEELDSRTDGAEPSRSPICSIAFRYEHDSLKISE